MDEYKLKDFITEDEKQFAPKYDIQNEINTISEFKDSLPENKYKAPTKVMHEDSQAYAVADSIPIPRITIINDDGDLSALNKKQRQWIEKIEGIKHDELLNRLKQSNAVKSTKADFDEPTDTLEAEALVYEAPTEEKKGPIIPPFKEDAPFAQAEQSIAVNTNELDNSVAEEEKEALQEVDNPPPPPAPPITVRAREPLVPSRRLKRLSADEILEMHKKDLEERRVKSSSITVSEAEILNSSDAAATDKDIENAEKLAQLYYASSEEEYK